MLVLGYFNSTISKYLDPFIKEYLHHPALEITSSFRIKRNLRKNFVKSYENLYNFDKANFPRMYQIINRIDWCFLEIFTTSVLIFMVSYLIYLIVVFQRTRWGLRISIPLGLVCRLLLKWKKRQNFTYYTKNMMIKQPLESFRYKELRLRWI